MAPHSVRPHSNVRLCPDAGSILSDVRTDSAPVTNEWAEYSCAAHRTEGSRLGEDCTFSRQLPSQLIDQQLVVMMMMRNQEPERQRAGDMKMETFHPPPERRAGVLSTWRRSGKAAVGAAVGSVHISLPRQHRWPRATWQRRGHAQPGTHWRKDDDGGVGSGCGSECGWRETAAHARLI